MGKAELTLVGGLQARASRDILGSNIEAYEHTIPSLLSDRLRNAKFHGPENPQTGLAPDWEPILNGMAALHCRLVPGMYCSGRQSQRISNEGDEGWRGILQAGVPVRDGERYELELWTRAVHRPLELKASLWLDGQAVPEGCEAICCIDQGHWHRTVMTLHAPGTGGAYLGLRIGGDSTLIIDQVHLRPIGADGVQMVSPAVDALLSRLPCPVLRFPGGSVTCTYHWEHGVGPLHRRPVCDDPVFKYQVHYDFGTDEYLDHCLRHGILPALTINSTTAEPADAAAWAAYIRAWYVERQHTPPACWFMIGNEGWGLHEISHLTGAMYVDQLRAFVPALRDAYPEARIQAIGEYESAGLRSTERTPWRSEVIREVPDLFDALAVTRYSCCNDSCGFDAALTTVAAHVADQAADLDRQIADLRADLPGKQIAIVEWNYWTRASHNDHAGFREPNDIRHCLFAAGYLHAMLRRGDMVAVANHYSLINTMGAAHISADALDCSALVPLFQAYLTALPADVLAAELVSPALDNGAEQVDVLLLRHGDQCRCFMINYHPQESCVLKLHGLSCSGSAHGLTASELLRQPQPCQAEIADDRITVPPASWLHVAVQLAENGSRAC